MSVQSIPVAPSHFRGRAFGLELDADFAVPGVFENGGTYRDISAGARRVKVTLTDSVSADRTWPSKEAERTFEFGAPAQRPVMTIERHDVVGYRVWIHGLGRCIIDPHGDHIQYAPPRARNRWLLLTGQALPIAAALQGLEVLHASAVVLHGRSLAFVANSGTGKTSIALHLLSHGAHFLADDVVALEASGDTLMAHPGVAIAHVPGATQSALADAGIRVDRKLDPRRKHDFVMPLPDAAAPLGAIYFLERTREAEGVEIVPLQRPDVRLLMGGTFVAHVPTAARLITQLDICSRIARTVPVFRVCSPPNGGADGLAERIVEHARAG